MPIFGKKKITFSNEPRFDLGGYVSKQNCRIWGTGNVWFQQDCATCLTTEATLDVMRPVFEVRIISRRTDVVWPPRSCDLTPLDYYFWGANIDNWDAYKPETIDALKGNIRSHW